MTLLLTALPPRRSGKQKAAGKAQKGANSAPRPQQPQQQQQRERGPDLKTLIKQSQQGQSNKLTAKDEAAAKHHLFVNTLKGHADAVVSASWDATGRAIVTACEDMALRVYSVVNASDRELRFKSLKLTRQPLGAGFGAGEHEVIACVQSVPDVQLVAFQAPRPKPGLPPAYEQGWTAGSVHGKEPGLQFVTACPPPGSGRPPLAVSLSTKKDARVLEASSGRQLAVLEPNSLANHNLAVSADGRFIAVSSFTAEVKIWEARVGRREDGSESGGVQSVAKAMDLKGHKSQVLAVAISADNRLAATASKDGTLRVWDLAVRYALQEDPKALLVMSMPLAQGKVYSRLAFSPGNALIAAACDNLVHFISSRRGELVDSIDAHDAAITSLSWSPCPVQTADGSALVLATASRDRRVRLWRSPLTTAQ